MNRRHFVLTSLAALAAAGCETTQTASSTPTTPWTPTSPAPSTSGDSYVLRKPTPTPAPAPSAPSPINAIPRNSWTRTGVDGGNINPMNGVNRITLHHDGMPRPLNTTDYRATSDYLEMIRASHRNRGWADIGYHYAVDKAGRIWAARPIAYQGAHVSDNNEHNIGVLAMGNFNVQQPTNAQLNTVAQAVAALRRAYNVNPGRIYTHREIGQTSCPGTNMQPKVNIMRSRNMFA